MNADPATISIPAELLPGDGRFGCGPSKVPSQAVTALATEADDYLGTSHRQPRVLDMVGRLRTGVAELFGLPDGYEVALGNGGASLFWDAATFGLITRRSQHLSFGEFSSKFAGAVAAAPHLGDPEIVEAPPGRAPRPRPSADVDAYALTHNETSTGVMLPIERPAGTSSDDALVLVDATSGAGGLPVDLTHADAYYFAPQKCLASDGGLWIALLSPAAIERIERLTSQRWCPTTLDLAQALTSSRKNQTVNTPALATVFLAVQQIEWLNANGGLAWAAQRCQESARTVYSWAEASPYANPFVADPAERSHVVATIDLDEHVVADDVCRALRANGIVDTESYRKLGRNQLRIALFPAIEPDDVAALTRCVDHVTGQLA